MSESEFDADLGRKTREYGDAKRELQKMVEATRPLADALAALGFGLWTPNDGVLRDEPKVNKALASLPGDLSIDMLRGWIVRCKEVRGRYLDLKSQLQPYGIE